MAIAQDIEQLSHARSPIRRAAAKRLRKLDDAAAGPALLAALNEELKDDRTWETQYQMIMAIGHCDYKEALPYIRSLISRQIGGMVEFAIGDTMLRLSRAHDTDAEAAIVFIECDKQLLAQGAIHCSTNGVRYRALCQLNANRVELYIAESNVNGQSVPFWL